MIMKTSVNMIRKLGDFEIIQRTKDGYFNATYLLKQWNVENQQQKRIEPFFRNEQTKAFMQVLENEEFGNNNNFCYFQKRGKKGGTWMHPYLFVKFAMWLNPKFEYFVIKFVYDQLIEYRNNAGDLYKGLTSAVAKFENVDYVKLAKGLNYIVFGRHEKDIRQIATTEQLNEMNDLQKKLAFAIDMGYIQTFDGLLNEMRRIYFQKFKNY